MMELSTKGRLDGERSFIMKPILETKDLVKYYGEGASQVRAIDHTDIVVEHGEFVAVVGRSGSGKSTYAGRLRSAGQRKGMD